VSAVARRVGAGAVVAVVLVEGGAPLLAPAVSRLPGQLGSVLGMGYDAFLAVGVPFLVAGMMLMLMAAVMFPVLRWLLHRCTCAQATKRARFLAGSGAF
jgi:hypothetical protein